MIPYLKSITKLLAILLLALPGWLHAQEPSELTTQKELDLIHIDLELDYGKLAMRLTNVESKAEGAIGIGYKERIRVMFAYGTGEVSPSEAILNGSYRASGNWMRYGADYFISLDQFNKLGLGLRFGSSNYDDQVTFGVGSDLFSQRDEEVNRSNIEASWIELVLHSETELFPNFFTGLRIRIRSIQDFTQESPVEFYTIPGYGRAVDNSIPAVNVYLKYRIGFGRTTLK